MSLLVSKQNYLFLIFFIFENMTLVTLGFFRKYFLTVISVENIIFYIFELF